MTDSLLIIEDESLFGAELKRQFEREGWDVAWARSLADARRSLQDADIQPLLVLADMNLPDGNSLDLLEELSKNKVTSEWIFLTGFGVVPDSVRALRLGAYDFLIKPCEPERLKLVVSAAARSARAQRRLQEESATRKAQYAPQSFIGSSTAAQAVREVISQLLPVPITALILSGETGTGKGLVARILHHSGRRHAGRMIEVNCAALPRELLESELFGHESGAFTGARGRRRGRVEQADGGTLFLDEIGEMPMDLQAKLLRVIEDQRFWRVGGEQQIEVDCQVIAASNQNFLEMVRQGRFRADLYHRLNVMSIELPPLRARIQDLEELAHAFLAHFNAKGGKNVRFIPGAVWQQLRRYHWPGNVRELRNVLERCVLLATDETIPGQWLRLETAPLAGQAAAVSFPADGSMSLDDIERYVISTVLDSVDHNVSKAARLLGMSRETLRYRLQKHGIVRDGQS
jgi:DNA-binding NtrC family response regulator